MRTTLILTILIGMLIAPIGAVADGHTGDRACGGRDRPCTEVDVGEMSCMPPEGAAGTLSAVVGAADEGTFELQATGTSHAETAEACVFEVRVDASQITFNEGYAPDLLAPYGGASNGPATACIAAAGSSCQATATFTWWRAEHGVTFDVPFTLWVNGVQVAEGSVHYYDPPMFEDVAGGPVAVSL